MLDTIRDDIQAVPFQVESQLFDVMDVFLKPFEITSDTAVKLVLFDLTLDWSRHPPHKHRLTDSIGF